jgi:EAL domain-containing protein (putative c-di-GMP-specific phosphodiesterase class I)
VLEHAAAAVAGLFETRIKQCLFAFNVAPAQFRGGAIKRQIERLSHAHWLDPGTLELEMTQRQLRELIATERNTLYGLRDMGVRFALDRLGADLIDPGELLRSPLDTLKLDRSLVQRLPDDPAACALIAQMVEVAQRYSLDTVAVGVETEAAHAALTSLGVDAQQGYALSAPLAIKDFGYLLADQIAQAAASINAASR